MPLGVSNSVLKQSRVTALGVWNDGRLHVVIETVTGVGPLRTRIDFTPIPPEGHGALREVLDELVLPAAQPRAVDTLACWFLRASRAVAFAGATCFVGAWVSAVVAIVAGEGAEDALSNMWSWPTAVFFGGFMTHTLALFAVGRAFGEPSAATKLRLDHGVPGPVRLLGRWTIPWKRPVVSPTISALVTLNRRYFAIFSQLGAQSSTLPLPAATAAPLREALERAAPTTLPVPVARAVTR